MDINNLSLPLDESDIEIRIGATKQGSGFSILLYKTARTDRKRLNEVCGLLNWQDKYYNDSKGNVVCIISIWDSKKEQWISKEDVGTESMTEKEKGSYSDALKRAGFAWSIGAELYDAPFMWVNWKEWNGKNPSCSYDIKEWRVTKNAKGQYNILDVNGNIVWKPKNTQSKKPVKTVKYVVVPDDVKRRKETMIKTLENDSVYADVKVKWIDQIRKSCYTAEKATEIEQIIKKHKKDNESKIQKTVNKVKIDTDYASNVPMS